MQAIESVELANVCGGRVETVGDTHLAAMPDTRSRAGKAWDRGVVWGAGEFGVSPRGVLATVGQNARAGATVGTLGAFPIATGLGNVALDTASRAFGR